MNVRGDESAGSPEPDRCVGMYELNDDYRVDGAYTTFSKVVSVGVRWRYKDRESIFLFELECTGCFARTLGAGVEPSGVGVAVQCDDVNTECGVYPVDVCLSAIPDFRVIFEQVNGDIERVVFHEEVVACISVNVRHDEGAGEVEGPVLAVRGSW
jgi:hypothetical protein